MPFERLYFRENVAFAKFSADYRYGTLGLPACRISYLCDERTLENRQATDFSQLKNAE
jgi:hypothetical protein